MTKTKKKRNIKYKESLYSNLLVACKMSEPLLERFDINPKMVLKEEPSLAVQPMVHRQQQTFVMRWNPDISSYKLADFEYAIKEFFDDDFYFDWSVWEYQQVHIGDRFYMLKVGDGNTGIVMSGVIISTAYKDEDWSGKGRDVHYVRMMPDCIIHPEKTTIITTQFLDEVLPGVNWNEGHSGVLLNETEANKFAELWYNYLNNR